MSVVSLRSAWTSPIRFNTSALSVREIDLPDTSALLRFIRNNLERIARVSPTYAHSDGDLTEGRILRHIIDWRADRQREDGSAMMVCFADGGPDIKATLSLEPLAERGLYEVGVMSDKSAPETMSVEAMEGLTLKIAFNRLNAKAVRCYPLPDDLESRGSLEKAGFTFLHEEARPLPFFDISLMRNYAVYERRPS